MLKWHVAQPVGLISIAALQQAENHVPSLLLVPSSKQSDFSFNFCCQSPLDAVMEVGEPSPHGYHHVADAEFPGPPGRKSIALSTVPHQNESSKERRALSSADEVVVAKSTEDKRKLWNSIFFRKTTLSGFILLFILLIGVL
jgi:hypothetical protein